ncbi:MAG: TIGR03668 family PPOX class F420-dependent oxidoreductase [Intrasporangium sp.]|uniref:TIGR03668 family PPOX class F420-dependent oxidoreductase n=1 Tax=Intrasporangium sp. TaxID=1925024 RepID=UPI0026488368|nr:TIGR03668 family PPOX class F420-dependent oxidoreductase [Intrasporangium sp.]MDN5797664.1 TIGR03668 family PPOX class F420-dependent oxidoreductase [Intrasporangium sp.]
MPLSLEDRDRERFAAAPVARLATVRPDGSPHVVPIVFALVDEVVWTGVDAKPKSTVALQRLTNIAAEPRVSLLVDEYDEDWSRLWWVRADGRARVVSDRRDVEEAITALVSKYSQYQEVSLSGPFVRVGVESWRSWASRGRPE